MSVQPAMFMLRVTKLKEKVPVSVTMDLWAMEEPTAKVGCVSKMTRNYLKP